MTPSSRRREVVVAVLVAALALFMVWFALAPQRIETAPRATDVEGTRIAAPSVMEPTNAEPAALVSDEADARLAIESVQRSEGAVARKGSVVIATPTGDEPFNGRGSLAFDVSTVPPRREYVAVDGGVFDVPLVGDNEVWSLDHGLVCEQNSARQCDRASDLVLVHDSAGEVVARLSTRRVVEFDVRVVPSNAVVEDARFEGLTMDGGEFRLTSAFVGGVHRVELSQALRGIAVRAPGLCDGAIVSVPGSIDRPILVEIPVGGALTVDVSGADPERSYEIVLVTRQMAQPGPHPVPRGGGLVVFDGLMCDVVRAKLVDVESRLEVTWREALVEQRGTWLALDAWAEPDDRPARLVVVGEFTNAETTAIVLIAERHEADPESVSGPAQAPISITRISDQANTSGEFEIGAGVWAFNARFVADRRNGITEQFGLVHLTPGGTTRLVVAEPPVARITVRSIDRATGEIVEPTSLAWWDVDRRFASFGPLDKLGEILVPSGAHVRFSASTQRSDRPRASAVSEVFVATDGMTIDLPIGEEAEREAPRPRNVMLVSPIDLPAHDNRWEWYVDVLDQDGKRRRGTVFTNTGGSDRERRLFFTATGTRFFLAPAAHPELGAFRSGWVEVDDQGLATFDLVLVSTP